VYTVQCTSSVQCTWTSKAFKSFFLNPFIKFKYKHKHKCFCFNISLMDERLGENPWLWINLNFQGVGRLVICIPFLPGGRACLYFSLPAIGGIFLGGRRGGGVLLGGIWCSAVVNTLLRYQLRAGESKDPEH